MPSSPHQLRRTPHAALCLLCAAFLSLSPIGWWALSPSSDSYDALIVPGGGLDDEGRPLAWVERRLDAALHHDREAALYLVLSRGTTHRPAPRDRVGFEIDEAAASAKYLMDRGVSPSRILLESWSLDTIGNAAFARIFHADILGWRRCLVLTSALHMPRTRTIFEWVFSLPPRRHWPVRLEFEEVPDEEVGAIAPAAAAARHAKEQESLAQLRQTAAAITTLPQLHSFLFTRHNAYSATGRAHPHTAAEATGALLNSY